jgi:hypothetical protein
LHYFGTPLWLGLAFTFGVCGLALWKGGLDERLAAGGFILSWIGTLALRDPTWRNTQWGGLVVDACFLVLLVGIALRSRRYWPMFMAAFQLLGVITYCAHLADNKIAAWTYASATIIWTDLCLLALLVGAIGTWRTRSQASGQRAP